MVFATQEASLFPNLFLSHYERDGFLLIRKLLIHIAVE
jgi:hypothetical protein